MEEKCYTVYMHICPNNKKYIGITKQNIYKRWAKGAGYEKCPKFYKAIQKYNWESIRHKILFTNLSKQEAEKKEIELIAYYKTNNEKYGYNIQNGGNTIGTHSETTKLKISRANKGKKRDEQFKIKNSENKKGNKNLLGYHHKEKAKNKISMAQKGNKNCVGRILSEETKRKISISHLTSTKKDKYKKQVVCIDTGVKYNSIKEAGRMTNINSRSIQRVCKGERITAGKLHWKFI